MISQSQHKRRREGYEYCEEAHIENNVFDSTGVSGRCAQNPLDAFPRSFPVDEELANLLPTCYGLVTDLQRGSNTGKLV